MRAYYDSTVKIPNGTWIGFKNNYYDFGYKDNIILMGCSNYSYLSERLIVLKKDKKIYIYSTNTVKKNKVETVEKIAEFVCFNPATYVKIILGNSSYLIDGNCQIKFKERTHIN